MSKGPGRIERALIVLFDAEPDNAFTIEDLCCKVYDSWRETPRKQRVSVLRAMKRVQARRDTLDRLQSWTKGNTWVYFNKLSVLSYGMARLKADNLRRYQQKYSKTTEAELLSMLLGKHKHSATSEHYDLRRYVQPGGAWHQDVQSWTAEIQARRAGKDALVRKIIAQREDDERRRLEEWTTGFKSAFGAKKE
jgi:hypothetical protein